MAPLLAFHVKVGLVAMPVVPLVGVLKVGAVGAVPEEVVSANAMLAVAVFPAVTETDTLLLIKPLFEAVTVYVPGFIPVMLKLPIESVETLLVAGLVTMLTFAIAEASDAFVTLPVMAPVVGVGDVGVSFLLQPTTVAKRARNRKTDFHCFIFIPFLLMVVV